MPVATLEINYDMPPGTSNKYKHIHTPSQRQAHIQRVSSHVWPSANTLLCTLHTRILKIDKYKCILSIVHHSNKSHLTLNTTPVQFIKRQSCERFDRSIFYSYTLCDSDLTAKWVYCQTTFTFYSEIWAINVLCTAEQLWTESLRVQTCRMFTRPYSALRHGVASMLARQPHANTDVCVHSVCL